MRARAGWALAVLVLVMAAGTSVYRDIVPGARTVPGFTLFAVEAGGLRKPVVHFDGRRWRSPCEDAPAPREPAASDGDVVAIEATRDTPLFPVHELTREAAHWDLAWKALAEGLVPNAAGNWVRETHVYTVQDRPPSTAFIDLSFRRATDVWQGISISGWVALEPQGARRLDARSHRFSTYAEFIALDRLAPLGVVHDAASDARVWVMRTMGPRPQEIRVVELADGVRELIRVQRGGCS